MLFPKLTSARWILSLTFFLNFPLQNAFSADRIVHVALEWGSSAQTYTYVFAGLVTCQNHPCSNARVDLNLDTTTEGVLTQTTRTGEDGRYLLEVTLKGAPADSSRWKLEAHSPTIVDRESAEAEGRVILMEGQTTVVVDRSLLLIQA